MFDTCDKYDSGSSVIVILASLERQTHTRARIIYRTSVSKSTISPLNFIIMFKYHYYIDYTEKNVCICLILYFRRKF